MRTLIILAFINLITHAGFVFAQNLAPEEILLSIKVKGPKAVVDELWGSEAKTKNLLAGVRSANKQWLEVAKVLAPGTDAGSAEDLDDALSIALLNAPYKTLPLLKKLWWSVPKTTCLFGYDSELQGGVAKYVQKLRGALVKMPPKGLKSLRQECIEGLDQTWLDLKNAPQ